MPKIILNPQLSIRSQIAAYYRHAIKSGTLKTGDKLPPARTLAQEFGTAEANVHHAIASLCKEGLIVRRPKAGTIVIRPDDKPGCIALYIDWHYLKRGEQFTRLLVEFVEKELAKEKIDCVVLYDTPAANGLAQLKKMVVSRAVQGIVSRSLYPGNYEFFSRLPVPFTGISRMKISNKVNFFTPEMLESVVIACKRSGAERVGIFSPGVMSLNATSSDSFSDRLAEALLKEGISLSQKWIFDSLKYGQDAVVDSSAFAYAGFESLWRKKERPDTLILFSDDLVSGLTMSCYHQKVRIPEDLKLIVHRTSENPVIFPFPCMLLTNSIREIASLLVGQLLDLIAGRPVRTNHMKTELISYIP